MYDTYVGRKKNETDELYDALNSYHQSVKLTLELNPTKSLDTEIIWGNSKITTQGYNKFKTVAPFTLDIKNPSVLQMWCYYSWITQS